MGYYVNPETETKEEFLTRVGERVTSPTYPTNPTKAIVALVDNGLFSAAGICYSRRELEAFTSPTDRRPRSFYLVAKNELYKVSDITPERFEA